METLFLKQFFHHSSFLSMQEYESMPLSKVMLSGFAYLVCRMILDRF